MPAFERKMPANSLTNVEITYDCIVNALKKFDVNGSPGPDGISNLFIKNIISYLAKPLKIIFNISLRDGMLPNDWKSGVICPMYKNNVAPHECV